MASAQRTRAAGESIGYLAVVAVILVLLNVIGFMGLYGRSDWTGADLFSLSEGSMRLSRNLDDRMQITAYFTEDMPPPSVEVYTRDILAEYEAAAGGNIELTIINPDEDDEKEDAEDAGLTLQRVQAFENDGFTYKEGYRGIVIRYLGNTKVIDIGTDTSGLEYQITTAIKEMAGDKKKVGVLSGHGSPGLTKGLSNLNSWLRSYELQEVSGTEEIDQDLAALLIINPTEEIDETTLRRVDQYVMHGGSLGIFGGSVNFSLEGAEPSASMVDTGLNRLTSRWGVRLKRAVVLDTQCMPVPTGRSILGMRVQMPYFAIPITSFDDAQQEHPVAFRLGSAVMPFAAQLELTEVDEAEFDRSTIARSSEQSWLATDDSVSLRPRDLSEWPEPREIGPFPLVIAVEGTLPSAFAAGGAQNVSAPDAGAAGSDIEAPAQSESEVRVLVAGSGMFMIDQFLPPNQEEQGASRNAVAAFALNAIDWLAQDSDLVAIRAKTVEDPALEVPQGIQEAQRTAEEAQERGRSEAEKGNEDGVEDAQHDIEEAEDQFRRASEAWDRKKALYRWLNTLGIPIAFALFGLLRWQWRQGKKKSMKL